MPKKRSDAFYEDARQLYTRGWINFALILFALTFSLLWLGQRYLKRENNKRLNAAATAWAEQRVDDSLAYLATVKPKPDLSERLAHQQALTWLVTDPQQVLEHIDLKSTQPVPDNSDTTWRPEARLRAAILRQDWEHLKSAVSTIEAHGLLPASNPTLLTAQAYLDLQNQDVSRLRQKIGQALSVNPLHHEALFLRSQLQAMVTNPAEQNQANVSLRQIAESDGPNATRAWTLLLSSNLLVSDSEWNDAIAGLKASPYLSHHYITRQRDLLNAMVINLTTREPAFAYQLAQQLERHHQLDTNERIRLSYLAQETGDLTKARSTLSALPDDPNNPVQKDWLTVRQDLLEHQASAALQRSKAYLDTPHAQQFAEPLIRFAQSEKASNDEKTAIGQALVAHDTLPLPLWLEAAAIVWTQAPQRQARLIEQCESRASENPLATSYFLTARQAPEAALRCLAHETRPEAQLTVFSLKLSCHLQLQQWEETEALVEAASAYADALLITQAKLMLRFRSEPQESHDPLWQEALSLAQSATAPTGAYCKLGDIAYEARRHDKAEAAYQRAASRASFSAMPELSLQRYLQLSLQDKETRLAHQILEALKSANPNSERWANEYAYLSLLLNLDTLAAKDQLKASFTQSPTDLWLRAAFALAQVKTGQESEALQLLENADEEPTFPAWYAIRVFAYNADGQSEAADKRAQAIDRALLLPEEAALLDLKPQDQIETIELPEETLDPDELPRLSEIGKEQS